MPSDVPNSIEPQGANPFLESHSVPAPFALVKKMCFFQPVYSQVKSSLWQWNIVKLSIAQQDHGQIFVVKVQSMFLSLRAWRIQHQRQEALASNVFPFPRTAINEGWPNFTLIDLTVWKNEECGWQGECRETQRDASRSYDCICCMSMHVHWSHLASELKFGELMRSAIEPTLFAMKFEDLSMRACGPFTDKRWPPCTVLVLFYLVPTGEIQDKSDVQEETKEKPPENNWGNADT